MNDKDDLVRILSSNHPAKPYLIGGGLLAAYGLLRSGATALGYLLVGGFVLAKGFEEIQRNKELHDGNSHGTNRPPLNA